MIARLSNDNSRLLISQRTVIYCISQNHNIVYNQLRKTRFTALVSIRYTLGNFRRVSFGTCRNTAAIMSLSDRNFIFRVIVNHNLITSHYFLARNDIRKQLNARHCALPVF